MIIPNYPKVTNLENDDLFIVETSNGTKTINGQNLKKETITDISGKVDKVDGKGLSSEDFTLEDKNKLETLSDLTSNDISEIKNAFKLS